MDDVVLHPSDSDRPAPGGERAVPGIKPRAQRPHPRLAGWHNLVNGQSARESFYLAFVVGLHVATAVALILYFWRDWVAIARGFFHSLKTRSIETADERIAWLLVVASIPVGLTGYLFEHTFRTLFAKPLAAAVFLMINGLILAGAELLRRRQARTGPRPTPTAATSDSVDYKAGDLTPSVAADQRRRRCRSGAASPSGRHRSWRSSPASVGRVSPWRPAWCGS